MVWANKVVMTSIEFLIFSLILSLVIVYLDREIEWLFPNSDFSKMDESTDDMILHIGSHEDMH